MGEGVWGVMGDEPIPHRVCREDDNGVRFEVGEFPSRIGALLKIEELAKGGPKQCYWTEVAQE